MRHLELFAGVGGFRMAMDYIQQDLGVINETIGFSEIDTNATKTYTANYDTNGEIVLGDIVSFIEDKERLAQLPNFDILSGGFPCQTFSMMGKQDGFNEERGQMFFRIMDIINLKHPQYVLLENVKNLLKHDKGNTISVIRKELESAGYIVKMDVFNSNDYGLPQKRNRIIIFARDKELGDFDFSEDLIKETFDKIDSNNCSLSCYESVLDILERKVDDKYYLSEKIKPTILSNGSKSFKSNSEIDQIIARPLTATMHKMHRACQDNYYSDIFIKSSGKKNPSLKMTKEELAKIAIRRITPKEAFMLQGFPSSFAKNASNVKVADGALYKQAGNAVSVNTIYAVLYYLIKCDIIKNG